MEQLTCQDKQQSSQSKQVKDVQSEENTFSLDCFELERVEKPALKALRGQVEFIHSKEVTHQDKSIHG